MARKASIFRLDPEAQAALGQLAKLLSKPMNALVNEAVRGYLATSGSGESEIAGALANLRAYRAREFHIREVEPAVLDAVRQFAERAALQFSVKGFVLFGSRARRTHRPDSDVDLAVLLRGAPHSRVATSLALADIAYDILLESQLDIQPVPIWEVEWDRPENHSNPRLVENIRREGTFV